MKNNATSPSWAQIICIVIIVAGVLAALGTIIAHLQRGMPPGTQ